MPVTINVSQIYPYMNLSTFFATQIIVSSFVKAIFKISTRIIQILAIISPHSRLNSLLLYSSKISVSSYTHTHIHTQQTEMRFEHIHYPRKASSEIQASPRRLSLPLQQQKRKTRGFYRRPRARRRAKWIRGK